MLDSTFLQGVELIQIITGKELSEKQVQAYRILLDDIQDQDFVLGINNMLRERVYSNFPMPAEIREYCLGTRKEDLDLRVAKAVTKIKKAIGSAGMYTTVAFDDPIIHLVIRDFGGWTKLCEKNLDEFENLLKWDLPKLYKAYASRKNAEIPTMLEGKGADKTITYIGDKAKAQKWILAYNNKQLGYDNKGVESRVEFEMVKNVNHLLLETEEKEEIKPKFDKKAFAEWLTA